MRFFSLFRVEFRRLLLTRRIWLISALCLLTPLLGYSIYTPSLSSTMAALYIGDPVSAGTTAGAVLWAFIAVFEANRQRRSRMDILAEAIVPPVTHSVAEAAALITVSTMVTLLCSLVYLPYTAVKLDYLFNPGFYFFHYLIFMMPTWWMSVLFAEGFYRITQRVELSVLLYALLAYMCYSRFAETKYLLWWLNPIVGSYSDGFPDIWFLRIGAYSRFMWLCTAAGLWTFSLICQRKYQKGLPGSFAKNLRKVYLPISAAVFITVGTVMWNVQPFIGHGGAEFNLEEEYRFGNQLKSGEVWDAGYFIKVNPLLGSLSGRVEYRVSKPVKGEGVFRLNAGYKIKSMTYGGEEVDYYTVKEDINGQYDTYFELPEKGGEKLVIEYGGFSKVAQCHMPSIYNSVGKNYIHLGSTDLVPMLGNYGTIGSVRFEITIPDDMVPFIDMEYKPITRFVENGDGTKTYMEILGSAYIFGFVAGNYVTDYFSSDEGIDFRFIYGDIYRSVVEEYDVRKSICDVYDYCTRHYGKSPFVGKEPFTLLQLSSLSQSGFAVEGLSSWYEDVISPNTLKDSNRGANSTEIFIHEMIHQWWGGVGMWCEDDGLWSAEGLTVYSTYRLIKEKYGELYAKQYYVDDWKGYVEAQNRNFYNRHPEYLDRLPDVYKEQLNVSNDGVNRYKRMPLMILKAEELVGGEEKMDEILRKMYSDYNKKDDQYEVTYKEFLDYCGLTEEDLEIGFSPDR